MAILTAGVILGFTVGVGLCLSRMWHMEDRAEYFKKKADFYEQKCIEEHRERLEWAKCEEDSNLFTKF